jgi:hypothetical protein
LFQDILAVILEQARRKAMVERSTLIQEIDSLPPYYYGEVIDFVGYIKEKKLKINFFWKKPL